MKVRRRTIPRFNVECSAYLCPVGPGIGERTRIAVAVRDLSLEGAGLISRVAVAPGTVWQLHIALTDGRTHDITILIRTCRNGAEDTYQIGVVYVCDPSILAAAGVDADRVSDLLSDLEQDGERPAWHLRQQLVATEAISATSLAAINVSARRDLMVSEGVVDCTLDVSGRLLGPSANLWGGSAYVLRGVTIGELGSPDGSPTLVVLGQSLSTSIVLDATKEALTALTEMITSKRATIDDLKSRPASSLTHADRETLTVLMSELPELIDRLARMNANMHKIADREASVRNYQLDVARAIHPGVTVIAAAMQIVFTKRLSGPLVLGLRPDGEFDIISTPDTSLGSVSGCATVKRLAA